jgi:hypothetical protein
LELQPKPDEVVELLDKEWFRDDERAQIATKLREALEAILRHKSRKEQEQSVSQFLREVWKNYANEIIADVLMEFPTLERSLFSMVPSARDGRYREHFIHTFNTYIFGAIIISSITSRATKLTIEKLLKVTDEGEADFPFSPPRKPYSAKRRALFLWTLMAMAHDIAMPIHHLEDVEKGLNNYLGHFGLRLTGFNLQHDFSTSSRINYYIDLMARLFDKGIILAKNEKGEFNGRYELSDKPSHPFLLEIGRALEQRDHGILSAICIFRSMEQAFLTGTNLDPSLRLDMEGARKYVHAVLEQDITRAALAVALHSLEKPPESRLYRISFKKFPLTFLLILCDELQECYRSEFFIPSFSDGIQLVQQWAIPEVTLEGSDDAKLRISTVIKYEELPPEQEKVVIDEYNAYFQRNHRRVESYKDMLRDRWANIIKRLTNKLNIHEKEALKEYERAMPREKEKIELQLIFTYKGTKEENILVE